MEHEIINRVIQVVAGGIAMNLIVQGLAMWASWKLLNYRLDQAEKKITGHDELYDRMTRAETKLDLLGSAIKRQSL